MLRELADADGVGLAVFGSGAFCGCRIGGGVGRGIGGSGRYSLGGGGRRIRRFGRTARECGYRHRYE